MFRSPSTILRRGFDPDALGNRTGVTFANGAGQVFGYDIVSRLSSLTNDLAGTANDLTKTFAYNPASQIVTETKSNTAYSFAPSNRSDSAVTNGKNWLTHFAGKGATSDGDGNLNAFGSDSFSYSSENLLGTATVGGVTTTITATV